MTSLEFAPVLKLPDLFSGKWPRDSKKNDHRNRVTDSGRGFFGI